MMILLLLVSLLGTGSLVYPTVSCEEIYVRPNQPPNLACPGEPCHTLADYASNTSLFIGKENISLLFMDGLHRAVNELLELSDLTLLTFSGVNDSYDIDSPQVLLELVGVSITNVSIVEMRNMSITGIGLYRYIRINQVNLLINNQMVFDNLETSLVSTSDAVIERSRYQSGSYFKLPYASLSQDLSVKLKIVACTFRDSNLDIYPDNPGLIIPGMWIIEVDLRDSMTSGDYGINIQAFGHATVTFENCTISNSLNRVSVFILNSNSSLNLDLTECYFSQNIYIELVYGGKVNVTILNSDFSDSEFPGLHAVGRSSYDLIVDVRNSTFTQFDMFIQDKREGESRSLSFLLKNVSFTENADNPSVTISGPANVTIEDCLFHNNNGLVSILYAYSVSLFFGGTTFFSNNHGSTGGALYLSQSTMWLENGASIHFINNTATVGGAIYVEESRLLSFFQELIGNTLLDSDTKLLTECFYQLTFNVDTNVNTLPALLYFENNSAVIGGDNIYGASLKNNCTVTPNKETKSYEIESILFQFQNEIKNLSSISSDPKRICLCEDGVPQCEYLTKSKSVTPGEIFSLSVALVGYDFGTVSGGVYAAKQNESNSFSFRPGQSLQQLINNKCTDLNYSVHTNHKDGNADFILSTDSIRSSLQNLLLAISIDISDWIAREIIAFHQQAVIGKLLTYFPVVINVRLRACPLGFTISTGNDNLPACGCEEFMQGYVHNCTVTNGTGVMYRNGTSWVSRYVRKINQTADSILLSKYCPFDYCMRGNIPVDLYDPDVQCALNRSGILCGGCSPNLSLALGSSRCLACSNDGHIALLLVFIVAGIALVFFIKVFDLTVARGTINGLVLYANIIWINQSIFFPKVDLQFEGNFQLKQFWQFLKVFIAWLNLDLGIETCLFDGLDAYWKAWLQFLFPIYIWLIAGVLILACRHSTRATRLFGNNAVSVLGTLFLLSYVKLLRTIISVLGFAFLQRYDPEGITVVWLADGNVPYLGLSHSFLFVAALLTLLFLWLPYTAVLTLVPLLRKMSGIRILCWINKFKPFFDTYYGPLKDKHHYWIGVTLIARLILALVFATTQAVDSVNVLLVNVVSALLVAVAPLAYKSLYVSLLEVSFLINLVIVSVSFLSTNSIESRVTYTLVSVVVSFVLFICIVGFHLVMKVKNYCQINWRNLNGYQNLDRSIPDKQNLVNKSLAAVDYREPLESST